MGVNCRTPEPTDVGSLRFYYVRDGRCNVLAPTERAGAAARLLPQGQLADHHPAVGRLAHVVDGEGGDAAGVQRLHLDAGAVDRVDLDLHADVVVADLEVDVDRADEEGV